MAGRSKAEGHSTLASHRARLSRDDVREARTTGARMKRHDLVTSGRSFDDGALPAATAAHETRANSVLRPIVFGANDGLVSNLALVMGVAGANPEPGIIVLAGIAGLLAGAFSMGVGEYISVQSQREL